MVHRLASLGATVLLAASFAAPLAAQPSPSPDPAAVAKPKKALMVLTPYDVAAQRFIAPPPTDGDAFQRAELAELHRIIAAASAERMAQAKWDDDHEDPSAFYAVIGGGFDLKTLPATAALMEVVMNDQSFAASATKKAFPRSRPWAADPTIKTCDPDDKPQTSYPSGHATMGYTVAAVFAALMPEKAEALQTRARDYAFSREVCGSHYPSDTEASHALAEALAVELLAAPALQDKLAAARAELKHAGFTSR